VADAEARRERIQRSIAALAQRPNAVQFDEVDRIVGQIKLLGEVMVVARPTTHGYQYTIGTRIVRVKKNQRGPMKKCYVEDFLDAMIDLGLYEE